MTALLSVFFLAASTFATPSAPSAPALCSGATAPVEQALFASGSTVKSICIADCGSDPDVQCSAETCSAANRSCPGEPGHVTCGSTTYWCATPCPECTDGQFKNVTTGPICSCEDGMRTPKDHYECIGGQWVYQYSFCGGPFCPGY